MHTRLVASIAFVVLLVSSVLCIDATGGEKPARAFRIGALTPSWGATPQVVALRDGLRELGYRESEQFDLGVRFTQGELAVLPAAARELVQHEVDLIFADSDDAARAAQLATTRIPIVFINVTDPIGIGLVESFARPGGNITGITDLELDLGPKRLQVFREMLPGLKRVLFAYNANHPASVAAARIYRDAASRHGIALVAQAVHTAAEARATLAQLRMGEGDGLLVPPSISLNIPGVMLEVASQRGIPTMFAASFFVERGGLASYGPDLYDSGRMAARLVDKIIKGAQPATLPVEVNPDLEFVINLNVARALGLTIAPEILYQTHRLVR